MTEHSATPFAPAWPAPTWQGTWALGGPACSGRIRARCEDFRVDELLGFEADGEGEHWLLQVEKTGSNTAWVAGQLARAAGVSKRDVGYSGLKDRHAVTVQHFSLPVRRGDPPDWERVSAPGFRVLAAWRHRRKLRRGSHRANRFHIRVTGLAGDRQALEHRLHAATGGVPNYFGEQRFGRGMGNLSLAARVLADPRRSWGRADREFALSAARALAFNEVLAARVRDGSWDRLLPGDLAMLAGSHSVFAVAQVDEALRTRLQAHDLDPTGPMPGTGGMQPGGDVLALEQAVCASFAGLESGLQAWGARAERRRLRLLPQAMDWSLEGEDLALHFELPAGSFATAVLRELVNYGDGDDPAGEA